MPKTNRGFDAAKQAVVQVGTGRGFLVEGKYPEDPLIITAAHCLWKNDELYLPPPDANSYTEEKTYPRLIGPLGAEPTIWAECMFVDPVGDIAVLGPPDDQELSDDYESYGSILGEVLPLAIKDAPSSGTAWILSLDGRWTQCKIQRFCADGPLSILEAEDIAGGMSGSPILADTDSAIGVVTSGSYTVASVQEYNPSAPCSRGDCMPVLKRNLPGWFWSWGKKMKSRSMPSD
jgi:hypothetical protein